MPRQRVRTPHEPQCGALGKLRSVQRLERLINLVAALLEASRPLTRQELRERVPGYSADEVAFRRAFERDKDALRQMGIPIDVEPVDDRMGERSEGYRVRKEEYSLPDPGLDSEELAALHLAATAVRLEDDPATAALWKLGGAPGTPAGTTVAALPQAEHLGAFFGAIADRRSVSFEYRGVTRHVDPYRLAFRNGHWYLTAFDRDRNEERSFRLDRVDAPPIAGDPDAFERPPESGRPMVPPWRMGDDESLTARLLVDERYTEWAEQQLGAEPVERRPDGGSVFEVQVSNRDAFRAFVLGFLDHAEVLEPPVLRDDLVEWLLEVAS